MRMRASFLLVGVLGFFALNAPTAIAAAPFGDTFDTYIPGNLYSQGLWQNNEHAWDVTGTGCKDGQCIVSTGINGTNWKSGSNVAAGEWRFDFYMNNPSYYSYVGPSIIFGSAEHPQQSSFGIRSDDNRTFYIMDGRGNRIASGLATQAWHTFEYRWDMQDPHNCAFSVSIDGGEPVASAPSTGGPTDCYGNVYAEHAIGALALYNYYADRGQLRIDNLSDGPVVDGCMFNCDGSIPAYIEDSFDHFNDRGWATLGGTYRVGAFEDPSSGACYQSGCVRADAGAGGLGGGSYSTYMYLETGVGAPEGAYTLWAKVADGWSRTLANIGLCTAPWSGCGGNYTYWWNDIAPPDEAWHQYYFAWRQGAAGVEACLMRDDTDSSHCVWSDTGWAPGTQFDGVVLVGGGSRPDLGDHVWFDELHPVSAAAACTENCNSSVMFLPGIQASRLYRPDAAGEHQLWEPESDDDAMELAMNPDGTSVHTDVYTRDILDQAYVPGFGNVYKSFIESMDGLVSSDKIEEWKPVPYDWRYSLDQILESGRLISSDGSISYSVATSSPYIIQELKRLAATSRTGKVTLIAHSGGGLVAKALMLKLGPDAASYVDKIILVASPQVGTPQAIAALLHGMEQGFWIPVDQTKLSAAAARTLGNNMLGAYNLLPTASYFTYVDDPVVSFDPATMPDWVSAYGDVIHSQERQHAYLADTPGMRTAPPPENLIDPDILSDSLLTQTESVHQQLDAWVPQGGIEVIQIAGWGIPTTLAGIDYARKTVTNSLGTFTGLQTNARFTVDGDGTVVTPSALWVSTAAGVENYWVDLDKFNDDNDFSTFFGWSPYEHHNIFEVDELRQFVNDVITNIDIEFSNYEYISPTVLDSTQSRLRYTLHSPLTLDFYDEQGNHTGISTSSGQIEQQIPGTYYTEFGDVKYVFTDTDIPVRIIMDGYDTSTFTFAVEELVGDEVVASTTWQDMPVTPDTIVLLDVQSDIDSLSPMSVDLDGDGNAEFLLAPVPDGIVAAPKYFFGGFRRPINDIERDPALETSVFKAGSTVPVKFQVTDLDGNLVQADAWPVWLSPERGLPITDAATTSVDTDVISTDSYKWDDSDQQYIYNWSTKGLAAGYWYKIYAKLDDGTIYSVQVGLN